jgi:hypothetical protein
MAPPPARRIAASNYELAKAVIAMAGVRQLVQANISVAGTSDGTYTPVNAATRRVIAIHLGTGNNDIHFNLNAAASSSTVPVIPARYFVIDCYGPRPATPTQPALTADVLHFFNTTGTAITVYLVETD